MRYEAYKRMEKSRQWCFPCDQKVDTFVLVPGIDNIRHNFKIPDWSLYNESPCQ
jgi:hypothetical protein